MFTNLPYPPRGYHICPCCGTEFGNDDADLTHEQLREMWLAGGAHWFFGISPDGWNWFTQLYEAGLLRVQAAGREVEVTFGETASSRAISQFEYSVTPCPVS